MKFVQHLLKQFALVAAVFIFNSACTHTSKQTCEQKIIAFDFGSGSIKSKGALVDVCKNQILSIFHEGQTKSNFKEDIQKSLSSSAGKSALKTAVNPVSNGLISDASLRNAVDFVKQTLAENSTHTPLKAKAVGTAALREAKNSSSLVARLRTETNTELKIITQEEEALLAFLAVKSHPEYRGTPITVWDIGGGSQQIITETTSGLQIYKSQVASVTFKDEVISSIKKRNPNQVRTPNPMTLTELNRALKLSEEKATEFKNESNVIILNMVVGVGGVLSRSIPEQLQSTEPTRARLETILQSRPGKTDKDIGGQFAETDTTNLALVLGHMKAFGIDKFKAEKINLTDGILINPKY